MIRSIPMFSKFKFLTWYSQLSIIRYIQLDLQVVILKVTCGYFVNDGKLVPIHSEKISKTLKFSLW